MQATSGKALGKRARYYHSQIDMELMRSGEDYVSLPKTYAIFICESVIELLEEHGEVSAELCEKILSETDTEILKVWHKLAAKTESIEQFVIDAKNV